jgi:streptogramin lyase
VLAFGRAASSPSVIAADSVGAISAGRGAITGDAQVGSLPSGVAAGAGAVWVSSYNDGTVSRIDPATRAADRGRLGPERDSGRRRRCVGRKQSQRHGLED